ncbi:hypothetical protein WMF28_24975 [Sorangium sp. So ce590]|uniref:hypothetical protein n=1 Tax=Sorangium sp. So ce590 TaxID=3133317 RepID=UPI003F5FC0DF
MISTIEADIFEEHASDAAFLWSYDEAVARVGHAEHRAQLERLVEGSEEHVAQGFAWAGARDVAIGQESQVPFPVKPNRESGTGCSGARLGRVSGASGAPPERVFFPIPIGVLRQPPSPSPSRTVVLW